MTSQLQLMWKEKQDNAKFENLRMIRWQFICDECKNVKSGVLNIVKKMQNPLLCKDLQLFFYRMTKLSFARGVTPVTADGSVKFLPELFKFLQKTTYLSA